MKNFFYSFCILYFFAIATLYTQNIVISEYYNSSYPSAEWTELLVIQDNIDLVGYTLRDNVGTNGIPNNWQGGVRFRNNDLWKKLRAGTIIVIHHRGSTVYDNNKDDGYIEIGAENEDYFEKRCFGCNLSEWLIKALSIAQAAEIIQIIDSNDSHIHSLSHMLNPAGDYLSLPSPKANHPSQLSGASSVIVVPGLSLASYGAGNDSNQNAITNNPTLGKPNNSSNSVDQNQILWRELRQPVWNNPSLTAQNTLDTVKLTWSKAVDNFPEDKTQGYIIIRIINENDLNATHKPEDGKVYNVGDNIGTPPAKVIAVIPSSQTTNYNDYFPNNCGSTIVYRIFAYRYSKDDNNQDFPATNARGRSYNETDFGVAKIIKIIPPKPEILVDKNKITFCRGDSVNLIAKDDEKEYKYQWLLNGKIIEENKKVIVAKESGSYELLIYNSDGCFNRSEPVVISVMETPQALIYANYNQIFQDTTIILCLKDEIELLASGGNEILWIKDNNQISQKSKIKINSEGIYYAILSNEALCKDSTFKISVRIIDINYSFSTDTLYFYLNDKENEQEQSIILTNNSKDTLFLFNLSIPAYFLITNPVESPIIILPDENKIISVKYTPQKSGKVIEKITFETLCSTKDTIYLNCYKESNGILANTYKLEYPPLLFCERDSYDSSIFIINPNNEEVLVLQPIVNNPFCITNPNFPIKLSPNEKVEIAIKFSSLTEGLYKDSILFPYISGTKIDTLRIYVICEIISPDFTINCDYINIPPLKTCDEFYDTTLKILNKSKINLELIIERVQGIELDNYYILLESQKDTTLKIRFKPNSEGNFTFNIQIKAEPCNITKYLRIESSKVGVTFSFDKDTIDFGTLINCRDSTDEVSKMKIFAIGKGSDKSRITDVQVKGIFQHNIEVNKSIDDSLEFEVKFPSYLEGNYFGEIIITLDPCSIEKTLFIKGVRTNPKFSISSDEIDFSQNEIESLVQKFLFIKNNGIIAFTINAFDNITSPFSFDSDNPILPFTLYPDSSVAFKINYYQTVISKDSIDASILISMPCNISKNIKLKGETYSSDKTITILQYFANQDFLKVGDTTKVSVVLSNYLDYNLEDIIIDSIYFVCSFDPLVFDLLAVDKGNCLENNSNSGLSYIIYNDIGKSIVKIYNYKEKLLNPCKIIDFTFRGLLGNTLSTFIKIDTINLYSNKKVEVVRTNSLINIEDNCNLENRLVALYNHPSLNISQNIIEFKIVCEDKTTIKLYNLVGKEVYTIVDDFLKPNIYRIAIDRGKLASGIYFLVYKNGNIIKRQIVMF